MTQKYISRLYPSLLVVFLFLLPTCFLFAQENYDLYCSTNPILIKEYAFSLQLKVLSPSSAKRIRQRNIYKKNVPELVIGKYACPRISTCPFFIKDAKSINNRIESLRKIHSKCGNVSGRITNRGLAMRIYLTRDEMLHP